MGCHRGPVRLLPAIALVLGILYTHSPGVSADSKPLESQQWPGDDLLNHWREILSTRVDAGGAFLFEQAFTGTFGGKGPEQVSRTLTQFDQLSGWVDSTTELNVTQAAFLPELADDGAMGLVRTAVRLARANLTGDDAALADALRAVAAQLRTAAAAAPWRGFAATRRTLLGAVLSQRVRRAARFPPAVAAAVDDLLLHLFAAHRVSAAARGAVQFFHVSKSGGTNLCQAAGANGCASQGFDTRTNCLIRDFFDSPRWVSYNGHKFLQTRMSSRQGLPWFVNFHTFRPPYTCAQRRAYLLRDGYTFYANEYTNPPPGEGLLPAAAAAATAAAAIAIDPAAAAIYASDATPAPTPFRTPTAAAAASPTPLPATTTSTTSTTAAGSSGASPNTAAAAFAAAAATPSGRMCERDFVNLIMLRHPHDRLRSQIGWVEKLYKEYYLDVDTQPAFLNRTSGFWERLMPAAVDNYYTRSLLGQRFFEFPVLAVGQQHAELAKLAALQHDILLVLEDKGANDAALRCGLGWTAAGLREAAVRSSNELGDEVALPGDYGALLARNAPDVELYGFAREMAALDAMLWGFVGLADAAAGGALVGGGAGAADGVGSGSGGEQCGYVSTGGPAAAAALAERLREVQVPPKAAALAAAAAAPKTAAAGDSSAAGQSDLITQGSAGSAGARPLGAVSSRAGLTAAGAGGRGPAVVSISRRNGRRLLRLKSTLHGLSRRRTHDATRGAAAT